jgi:hypothetical protein
MNRELDAYRRLEQQVSNRRRISEIEESLSRPVEEGSDWDKRRAELEAEMLRLRRSM